MLPMNTTFFVLLIAGALRTDAVMPPAQLAAAPAVQETGEVDPFVLTYREAAATGDSKRLSELWSNAPQPVLWTIDADLERSLRLVEKLREGEGEGEPAGDSQKIQQEVEALRTRALFGARIAAEVLDRPLLADYAVSFAGWNRAQQIQFRKGQQTFGQAREAREAGDLERALELALKTVELAEPLGDWWGTGMGRSLAGRIAQQQGNSELALLESARARSIHRAIGFVGSEISDLIVLAEASLALGNRSRAAEAVRAGLKLAPEGSRDRAALEQLAERTQATE